MQEVQIPLSSEQMKYFFENKEEIFFIDLINTKLRGNVLLTYISNLGLNAEFTFNDVTSEDKLDLLQQFMTTRHIVSSKSLSIMTLQVLLYKKEIKQDSVVEQLLTKSEIELFISMNVELVNNWIEFLDSSFVFLMEAFEELANEISIKEGLEVVDDQRFIGLNVVNMFLLQGFSEIYFSVPVGPVKYFERQFNDYMFNGNKLFHYFNNDNNIFLHLMSALVNEQVDLSELQSANLL
tara:strand:+ start:66213 stop:66923 length:711 start_codon:yes stop_codon:yes gene_type:complete